MTTRDPSRSDDDAAREPDLGVLPEDSADPARDDSAHDAAALDDDAREDPVDDGDARDAEGAAPEKRRGLDLSLPRIPSLPSLSRGDGPRIPSLSSRSRAEGWDTPEGPLAKYRSRWRTAIRFVLQRVAFRALVRSVITQTVVVARRVRSVRGPYVLVANHTSHLDAPMLAQGLPWAQARFLSTGVAADYFFNVWYRRWFVRWMFNAFPIDRDGSRRNSGTSRRLLRSGVPILVFPEGTRARTGRIGEFKPGAAALAISVGVPVIPAALIGGHEAMPKGRSWPVKGRPPVAVVFGDPMIAGDGESAVEFSARIRTRVQELYQQHHDEILGSGPQGLPDEGDRP